MALLPAAIVWLVGAFHRERSKGARVSPRRQTPEYSGRPSSKRASAAGTETEKRSPRPPRRLGNSKLTGAILRSAPTTSPGAFPRSGDRVSPLVESGCGSMTSAVADSPVGESVDPQENSARTAWVAVTERARRELSEASFKLWFAELAPGRARQ